MFNHFESCLPGMHTWKSPQGNFVSLEKRTNGLWFDLDKPNTPWMEDRAIKTGWVYCGPSPEPPDTVTVTNTEKQDAAIGREIALAGSSLLTEGPDFVAMAHKARELVGGRGAHEFWWRRPDGGLERISAGGPPSSRRLLSWGWACLAPVAKGE